MKSAAVVFVFSLALVGLASCGQYVPNNWQSGGQDPAEVEVVELPFEDDGGVQQVHITLAPHTSAPGAVVVSFASSTKAEEAGVYYREEGVGQASFAQARMTQYNHTTFQNDGTYTSPYLYHALIEEVSTNITVFYEPVLTQEQGVTLSRSLRVPPLASAFGGDPEQEMKLAMVGDIGQTSNSVQTMDHITQELGDVAAMVVMGDLSYADNIDARWDNWGRLFEPVLDKIPLFGLPGNHEIETDQEDGVSFRPYAHRFQNMPTCDNGCGGFDNKGWKANMWYSYNIGSAHIIHVSSYHKYEAGSPQYMWLDRDLSSLDRTKTPWVIVNLHAPWYNSNVAHQGEFQSYAIRREWQPLLCQHRVNMMFAGHVHSYERVFPTCDNSTVDYHRGITYVNIGDGGNREGLYNNWLPGENGRAGPIWSAFREGSYGHGVLHIMNSTHAFWKWHRNNDGDKVTRDTTYIVNEVAWEAKRDDKETVKESTTFVNNFFDVQISFIPFFILVALLCYSIAITVLYKKRNAAAKRDYESLTEMSVTNKL
ncbi:metallophosphatase [Chloropicon primus]|uniref:Purple acid phosphatase n=1 Tax=Chloropicon primus TaxID=1764295 RepID=A0A5B8MTI4_9CHLO|nr:metallophosphatase [Chloropicon primus]UPR02924.1 metallophosphatase [Chloropicon primus]|eukprot:QDZ23711.1 metallophosphatase [Chloropicon primus]